MEYPNEKTRGGLFIENAAYLQKGIPDASKKCGGEPRACVCACVCTSSTLKGRRDDL